VGQERLGPSCFFTFLKVYIELGSYFLFLQEQTKDIIIMIFGFIGSMTVDISKSPPWLTSLLAVIRFSPQIRLATFALWVLSPPPPPAGGRTRRARLTRREREPGPERGRESFIRNYP